MTCEEFEELSGAYALGAVTPEEREAARAHIAGCAKCTRLAQELRAVVDVLPLSVTQVDPPESLKERLLAEIRKGGSTPARPVQTGQRPRQRRRWLVPLLAAAAVLGVMLFGGVTAWNISLLHQVSSLEQNVTSLQQQSNSLGARVTSLQSQLTLAYGLQGSGATGKLIYFPQQNITVLEMEGLPQLEGTQVYQGWLIHDNQPLSIGLLSVQNGIASVTFPGNITGYQTAAVSREPGPHPSKDKPAGPIVAAGELKQPIQPA
jgi:anti-sigma-K factor RskA